MSSSPSPGRKIERRFENPIDNLLIDLADLLCPMFYDLGFTPNMITGLSAVFGYISLYFLYKERFAHAGICFFIQYFFDCMDGYFARKYKMTSKAGDMFDHIKDATVNLGLMYVFYTRKDWIGIGLALSTIVCVSFQLGCQEIMYDSNESPTLTVTKTLSPCTTKESAERLMPYLRWLGCGTCNLALAVYLISKEPAVRRTFKF